MVSVWFVVSVWSVVIAFRCNKQAACRRYDIDLREERHAALLRLRAPCVSQSFPCAGGTTSTWREERHAAPRGATTAARALCEPILSLCRRYDIDLREEWHVALLRLRAPCVSPSFPCAGGTTSTCARSATRRCCGCARLV